MANIKSAKKRARQTIKKTIVNERVRSRVKKALRAARDLVSIKEKEGEAVLKHAISTLTKAANKGVIHRKTASRKISRLMAHAATKAKAVIPAAVTKKKATRSPAKSASKKA